jgi:uncharacterized protein DUF4339
MQIFVHRDGQQLGPYTVDQIKGELASGTLHAGDLAWHEGIPNWVPLSQMPELAGAAPPPVVTAAPPRATSAAPDQKVRVTLKDGRTVEIDAAQFKALKRKAGLKTMGYGALWFFGGLIVTGISYSMASSGSGGGTYLVTWGAVIIGGIQIVKGLIQFLSA